MPHLFSTSFCSSNKTKYRNSQRPARTSFGLATFMCVRVYACVYVYFSGRCEHNTCAKFYLFILFTCHMCVCGLWMLCSSFSSSLCVWLLARASECAVVGLFLCLEQQLSQCKPNCCHYSRCSPLHFSVPHPLFDCVAFRRSVFCLCAPFLVWIPTLPGTLWGRQADRQQTTHTRTQTYSIENLIWIEVVSLTKANA